jgi:all-trans-retinol 13,14-reductase
MGEYTNNLSIITYMRWDEMLPWVNTDIEKRGDDYLAFKEKKAQQLIDLVEKQIPGLKQSIKTYYTSTPLTYRDYTGTKEGSVYGILKDYNDPIKTLIFPRTRIPNLLFTGQNTNTHGVLGVTLGAVMTSATITGLNYLIKKINEA